MITRKVTLERQDLLPMPLIYLANSDELAAWYLSQLDWAVKNGQRELTVSCFDPALMGWDGGKTALTVLRALTTFLYDHPAVERLTILCGGEAAFNTYSFQWNMWFAGSKPDHD